MLHNTCKWTARQSVKRVRAVSEAREEAVQGENSLISHAGDGRMMRQAYVRVTDDFRKLSTRRKFSSEMLWNTDAATEENKVRMYSMCNVLREVILFCTNL